MSLTESQKQTLTWGGIIIVVGLAAYKIASMLHLLPVSSPTSPSADAGGQATASDYTHTSGFDAVGLAKQIHDSFKWFGTDPFTQVLGLIKSNVATQGDWNTLNNSFNNLYSEDAFKYFQDIGGGLSPTPFWDDFSTDELSQVTNYINSLPL